MAMKQRGIVILFLATLFVSSLVFFWRLGRPTLENWDEGIHAEVAREMYKDGAWLSMSYRNELYTAKPPLRFWMTAALFPLFGVTEFALRFWSACAGVATTMLLAWWAWQWRRRYCVTIVTAATFLFSQIVFLHAFRTGETDGLLTLMFVAALYAYWKSIENRHWFLWFGVFTGIAIMFKSIVGLLPVVLALVDLTIARRWRAIGFRVLLQSAALALLILLPWHIYETVRHGMEFWKSYIGFHVVDRAFETLYANNVPWWWYADVLLRKTYPYKFLVPIAVCAALVRIVRHRDAVDRLSLLTIALVFGIFSAALTKFAWYILPLFPFLSLLSGRVMEEFHEQKKRWLDLLMLVGAFGTAYILPTGLEANRTLWKLLPHAYLPTWFSETAPGKLVVAAVAAAILLAVFFWLRRALLQPRLVLGGAVLAFLLCIAAGWQFAKIRSLPDSAPLEEIARALRERQATSLDVLGVDLLRQPAGYFYLRRAGAIPRELAEKAEPPTTPYVLVLDTDPRLALVQSQRRLILSEGPYRLFGP
jgi:4-amino-4-deoxy-L-arabinose transferase-like glycosyltransferase